jgi:ABC-type nitrate/sulfonate/bicarbonate transport system permease component
MNTAVAAIRRVVARYYSIVLLLALWEAVSRSGLVSPRQVPSLVPIATQLWRYLANGDLIFHTGITLYRAATGFALASVGGVVVGTLMARSRWVECLIEPLFSFGYPIPKIALYPVLIFVFGLGSGSKIFLVFLECLYPIALHAYAGMRAADRVHVWAASNMGASQAQIFRRVLIPAALPILFSGLRIALPIALIVTIITEMIGESQGLGFFITFQSASFEYAKAFAGFAVIAIVGFALDRIVVTLRRRLIFWQPDASPLD